MLRRTIFVALSIAFGAVVLVDDLGGAMVMGSSREQLVENYEKAGVDVSACKEGRPGLMGGAGDVPACLEGSFKDVARKIETAGGNDAPDDTGAEADVDGDTVGEPEIE